MLAGWNNSQNMWNKVVIVKKVSCQVTPFPSAMVLRLVKIIDFGTPNAMTVCPFKFSSNKTNKISLCLSSLLLSLYRKMRPSLKNILSPKPQIIKNKCRLSLRVRNGKEFR